MLHFGRVMCSALCQQPCVPVGTWQMHFADADMMGDALVYLAPSNRVSDCWPNGASTTENAARQRLCLCGYLFCSSGMIDAFRPSKFNKSCPSLFLLGLLVPFYSKTRLSLPPLPPFLGGGRLVTGEPNLVRVAQAFVKRDMAEWLCWLRSYAGFDGWR